jgi:hypothetical protein
MAHGSVKSCKIASNELMFHDACKIYNYEEFYLQEYNAMYAGET